MKRIVIAIILVVAFIIPAYAQWGGGFDIGETIIHRNGIDVSDTWHQTNSSGVTSSAVELAGYNKVRVDYDVTGTDVSVVLNLQCSNDSLWVSTDSVTVTEDSYDTFDLIGCKDYNVYLTSISASDSITVYLTPFNTR